MLNFEAIETFLDSRSEYISKFSRILNMYKERFKVSLDRKTLIKWEDKNFLRRIRRNYEFLKINFYNLVKIFYEKTNLDIFEFQILPFVGLGYCNEWIEIYNNKIYNFLPLENISSMKSLIAIIYKNYAISYILSSNKNLLNTNFYNNLRNLILYGFGNFIVNICLNENPIISIWLSQRSIYKIWLFDLKKQLKYYSFRFLIELNDESFGQFSDWFLISRRGQYVGYEFFQFLKNEFKKSINLNLELYRIKFLEFYESIN